MDTGLCMGCMEPKIEGKCSGNCGFDGQTYERQLHQLPLETILNGKYLIGRVIGEGGFGITYIGWDLALQMKVAVKEYYPGNLVTRRCDVNNTVSIKGGTRELYEAGMGKFLDEARRLAKLWDLPGIVSVRDFFQENQTAYIVMEYMEGMSLKQLLAKRGGRLTANEVLGMMRPVMDSLEEIHKQGLIHRDISPDNLMFDKKGHLKLIDFGASREFSNKDRKSMSVIFKPGYAPVEQYSSKGEQGAWTDVYALCATIYRAITGAVPEESLDRLSGIRQPWPSEKGETGLTKEQEAALMKGMELQPKDRFQSIAELKSALYKENGGSAENAVSGRGQIIAQENTAGRTEKQNRTESLTGQKTQKEKEEPINREKPDVRETVGNKKQAGQAVITGNIAKAREAVTGLQEKGSRTWIWFLCNLAVFLILLCRLIYLRKTPVLKGFFSDNIDLFRGPNGFLWQHYFLILTFLVQTGLLITAMRKKKELSAKHNADICIAATAAVLLLAPNPEWEGITFSVGLYRYSGLRKSLFVFTRQNEEEILYALAAVLVVSLVLQCTVFRAKDKPLYKRKEFFSLYSAGILAVSLKLYEKIGHLYSGGILYITELLFVQTACIWSAYQIRDVYKEGKNLFKWILPWLVFIFDVILYDNWY